VGLVLALAGCAEGEVEPEALREAAQAHVETFTRFDAWARRAFAAETEIRDPARFEETLFAPIRRTEGVVGVWARRDGVGARAFAMGASAAPPPVERWVPIRAPGVDRLRAGVAHLPVGGNGAGRTVEALLLARRRPSGVGSTVEVVVAFVSEPGG